MTTNAATNLVAVPPNGKFLVEIKTVQGSSFKVLVEALKDLLIDCNIMCDETGLKIIALDNSHSVLVHLKLEAKQFEGYTCEKRIYIGVNMLKLFVLLKTVSNNDALTIFVEASDPNHLGIRIENSVKKSHTTYKLNMLDIPVTNIDIPSPDCHTIITLPSIDFQRLIRDMNNLAEQVEIKTADNVLYFSCSGESCSQETVMGETSAGLNIFRTEEKKGEIVQGIFPLKHLLLFTKCTNLSTMVELVIDNDYPIIVQYKVSSMGSIKLVLAPIAGDQ